MANTTLLSMAQLESISGGQGRPTSIQLPTTSTSYTAPTWGIFNVVNQFNVNIVVVAGNYIGGDLNINNLLGNYAGIGNFL